MVVPRTVGRYEIVDAIGAGALSTVYRAFDPTRERIVALKIAHRDLGSDITPRDVGERFRRELHAGALLLNHPSILTILDYDDRDPAGVYIVMEYVAGCALNEYVSHRDLGSIVNAMNQVLGGLAYAHSKDVVHRNIKLSNLLVTRDGLIKNAEFAFAQIGPRTQTQNGLMGGTARYLAPEQYTGGIVDHRCDIHAAGVVLYELMTGAPPFTGTSAEVMYRVCHEVPKPMSAVDPSIPRAFNAIVAKALEKLPVNRYASASDFQRALRGVCEPLQPKPSFFSIRRLLGVSRR